MSLLFNWDEYVVPALFALALLWGIAAFVKKAKRAADARDRERKSLRLNSSAGSTNHDNLHGRQQAIEIDQIADDSGFFSQRMRVKQSRNMHEAARQHRSAAHDNSTDAGLDEWAKHEEAKRRAVVDREAAERKAGSSAADLSAPKRADEHGDAVVAERPKDAELGKLYDEVIANVDKVKQQSADLDYIINKLETSVDFISVEFTDAVEKWKTGRAYRKKSLDDLKHTFRLKTFSLEDAWELVFGYPDWINANRRRILGFVERLGTRGEPGETLSELIARAEHAEWARDLQVDMCKVFMYREMKKTMAELADMERRLENLQKACNKRSGQVIAPSWKPAEIREKS